ncbi:MAG: sensor histidine kinase [Streptosporangiales bacterium]
MQRTGPSTARAGQGEQRRILTLLLRAPLRARAWTGSAYVLLGLLLAPLYYTIFPFLVVGLALLPFALLGTPFLWIGLALARGFANLERARLRWFFAVDVAASPLAGRLGVLQSPFKLLKSRDRWREVAYCALRLPLSTVEAGLVWGAWIGGLALLLSFTYVLDSVLPSGVELGTVPLLTTIGAALILTAPWLVRASVYVDTAAVRTQLAPSEKERLRRTRAGVVDAADSERRRIERDLHDGAQQRLVALAMGLGVARTRYDEDPDAVRGMIENAHEEAKAALAEIRELVRGIHPAVLTDRGLDAAISALAARCTVPVEVEVAVPTRPDVAVESAAYFIVAETLTNVAKHSRADRARVDVGLGDGTLRVVVADDGDGGAAAANGTGIAGLERRVAALDGTFLVDSPAGGPTRVVAELPCGS